VLDSRPAYVFQVSRPFFVLPNGTKCAHTLSHTRIEGELTAVGEASAAIPLEVPTPVTSADPALYYSVHTAAYKLLHQAGGIEGKRLPQSVV
jgi:hypothetical protein